MENSQLISFYEIVKAGSYSKAAKNLSITQSAVSHQIKNLEKELRIRLFERNGNMMKLTDGGEILFGCVSAFLNDLSNLKRISEDISNFKTGHLTVATNNAIIVHILPDVIKKFKEELPGIKLKLVNRNLTTELLPLVVNGEVDLAIGPRSNEIKILSSKIDFLLWKSFGRRLLMPADHPLAKKRDIKLIDVSAYPLLSYREGAVIRKTIDDAFAREELPYEVFIEMDVAENMMKFVKMGLGLAIRTQFTPTPEEKTSGLCCRDVSHFFGKVDYGIYHRKDKYITTPMKEFMRLFDPELYDKFVAN